MRIGQNSYQTPCLWPASLGQHRAADRKRDEARHNHRIQQQNTTKDAEKALKPLEATKSQTAASPWLSFIPSLVIWGHYTACISHSSCLTQLLRLPTGHSHHTKGMVTLPGETAQGESSPDAPLKPE